MEVEIRDARRGDIGAVRRVARATWDHAYRDTIPEEVRAELVDRGYSEAALAWRMENGVLLVAAVDREVVGFANLFAAEEEPGKIELAAIYVLPGMQGRGIGTRLLEAGVERFPSAAKVELSVESTNAHARRFYESHGFIAGESSTERFYGHELRVTVMTLMLS